MNREEIEKTEKGMLEDLQGRKHLFISFGGFKQGLGIPVFEFFNSIAHLDCDKILLRDYSQLWYHNGISDEMTSTESIVNYLKEKITENGYEKICVLGNSMGGYAAILYGVLVGADKVISFVPQSYLDRPRRFIYRDRRVPYLYEKLYKCPTKTEEYFNLKKLIPRAAQPKTKIHVFYSVTERLDKIHAERMKNLENVILHSVPDGDHGIVRDFKKSGELNRLIESAFK